MKTIFLSVLFFAGFAAGQTTPPVKAADPAPATRPSLGPDIDPVKFAASPFNSLKLDGTLRSFISSSYALANVWIYYEGDLKVLDYRFAWTYPEFYEPTWGEVFDNVSKRVHCSWSWDASKRQFKFVPSNTDPLFAVTLADGWRREDRGAYVWHAPKDMPSGMDIYDFGHFTIAKDDTAMMKKVRAYFAVTEVANWPNPPTERVMTVEKVGDNEALCLKTETPRPGGVWRQWSIMIDGHEYLIVNAMPKEKEGELGPQIQKMVESFRVHAAGSTTQPASPRTSE